MNKKVKPTEDYHDFLPDRVKESTKLDQSEKNVLATLCFHRLNYSKYAAEHNGWFYTSQKEIEEGAELSHMQANRILLKLIVKRVIERKSGTNHRCTHYRLHPAINELLPENPEDTMANDTLVITEQPKVDNDTLDKIRLDEYRKDESSLIEKKVVSEAPLDEDASSQQGKDWNAVIEQWKVDTDKAKTLEELLEAKKAFMRNGQGMPLECKQSVDAADNHYQWRYAALRNKH